MKEPVKDTYKTIAAPSKQALFKDRNSKFLGYAYPIQDEEQIKPIIEDLRKQHHSARHWCYAWQIGKQETRYRVNDDGEPTNSAGMPIYGQIQSFDLTNILIVVVRYFGGVKLGVGGLINAYRSAAQLALEASDIVTHTIDFQYEIHFDYPQINKVMRIIKENNLTLIDQKLELDCRVYISVRKGQTQQIYEKFDAVYKVAIKKL